MVKKDTKCEWVEWKARRLREKAKCVADEILVGSIKWTAGTSSLISKSEDNVDQEQNAVDDGKWALGDSKRLAVARGEAYDFACVTVVPVLQDQHSRSDEQGTSNDREEKICKWKLCLSFKRQTWRVE